MSNNVKKDSLLKDQSSICQYGSRCRGRCEIKILQQSSSVHLSRTRGVSGSGDLALPPLSLSSVVAVILRPS